MPLKVKNAPMLGDEDVFLDVEAAPLPTDDELANVRALAQLQVRLEERIAKGEAFLAELKAAHKKVAEGQLPLAMKALGLEKFSLVGGAEITVKKFTAASIPKDRAAEAFEIVEGLGEGSIIKHAITILFGRDEDAWARKFMRDMARRKKPLVHTRKDWIEPSTLGKFVRDGVSRLRREGRDPFEVLPKEVFGIYEGEATNVALPK